MSPKPFVAGKNCVTIHIEIPCIFSAKAPESESQAEAFGTSVCCCGKLKLQLHNPVTLESHLGSGSVVLRAFNGAVEEVVGTGQTQTVLSLQASPSKPADATDSYP